MCVTDLLQFCAVAVHTIPDSFLCRQGFVVVLLVYVASFAPFPSREDSSTHTTASQDKVFQETRSLFFFLLRKHIAF